MAKLPNSSETVRDPGLGAVGTADNTPVVIGVTASSEKNVLKFYESPSDLVDDHVAGPAVDDAAHILRVAGGPVGVISVSESVSGSAGSVVQSGAGPTVSLADAPTFDSDIVIDITAAGALGTAKFQFSLDGGLSKSSELTVPAGGTYVLPNGTTVTFASGSYVLLEQYTATGTCASFGSTELQTAVAELDSSAASWRFAVVSTSEATGDATAHALLATTLQAELDSMSVAGKYRAGMIAATVDDSEDVETDFASLSANRLLIQTGTAVVNAPVSVIGRAFPRISGVAVQAAAAASNLISTDLKRVLNGSLPRVVSLGRDARTDGGKALDDIMIATLRTYEGRNGFFITQARVKSQPGSDFTQWSRRVVMDVACEVTHNKQEEFIGRGVRVVNGGFIDERDAVRFEEEVQTVLDAQLANPTNVEGTQGHVSDVLYQINRNDNLLADPTVRSTVSILPLGLIDYVSSQLGFVASIGDN